MLRIIAYGAAYLGIISLTVAGPARAAGDSQTMKDAKTLQGDWVAIREEFGGQALTKAQLKDMNKRLTVKGNKFTIKQVVKEKLGTNEGRFDFDASTTPKKFDWSGKRPDGVAIEAQGIYELDGNKFRLCYTIVGPETKRPTEFKSAPNSGRVLVEFRREKDD